MKERYEFDKMEGCEWIRDTEELNQPLYYDLETVSNILNKQDKIIKQLESHAELLENVKAIEIVDAIKCYESQIRNLKQEQKQLAIEELEMFRAILSRAVLWDNDYECWTIGDEVYDSLMEQIDDKIKELK